MRKDEGSIATASNCTHLQTCDNILAHPSSNEPEMCLSSCYTLFFSFECTWKSHTLGDIILKMEKLKKSKSYGPENIMISTFNKSKSGILDPRV